VAQIDELEKADPEDLIRARWSKFESMGSWTELSPES
jgi:hypothetical protein